MALGLEALHCAGVTLQSVTVETPWKYTDRSYRRARDKEPVPTARGFDILATYKSPDMIERLLRAYHKRYPATTELVDMGRSHEGRKLLALKISRDVATSQGKAAVLLNGAHHGNELMSSEFVLDAIDYVLTRQDRSRQVKRWLDELVIWAVPMVNPDGRWHFLETTRRTGRKNGEDSDGSGQRDRLDGVDLNRNYPYRWHSLGERGSRSRKSAVYYRGHRAGSEPETQALMRLNNSEHFVASVSYHTGTVAVLAPYTIEGAKDPRPNEAWLFAEWLTGQLETHPEEREWELKRNLYAVDGTDQDWHRHAHGTLALLIEGARKSPRTPAGRRAVLENVRPTWTLLFDRVVRGTGVYGVVTDSEGRPVQAEVRLKEQKLRDGERWTSRCRDGRFDRVLARAGKWTLEVRVAGHPPVFKKFRARARRRQRVDVSLPFPVTPSSCPVAADPTVPFTEPREVPDSGSAAPPPP